MASGMNRTLPGAKSIKVALKDAVGPIGLIRTDSAIVALNPLRLLKVIMRLAFPPGAMVIEVGPVESAKSVTVTVITVICCVPALPISVIMYDPA